MPSAFVSISIQEHSRTFVLFLMRQTKVVIELEKLANYNSNNKEPVSCGLARSIVLAQLNLRSQQSHKYFLRAPEDTYSKYMRWNWSRKAHIRRKIHYLYTDCHVHVHVEKSQWIKQNLTYNQHKTTKKDCLFCDKSNCTVRYKQQ